MFASIAIALLLSLGIALVLLFVTKGVYPRFSPQALHILVAAFVIMGSTAAGAVALVSSKALGYVDSLEAGAKNVTGQVDAVQNQYGLDVLGISASDLADGYVERERKAGTCKDPLHCRCHCAERPSGPFPS